MHLHLHQFVSADEFDNNLHLMYLYVLYASASDPIVFQLHHVIVDNQAMLE